GVSLREFEQLLRALLDLSSLGELAIRGETLLRVPPHVLAAPVDIALLAVDLEFVPIAELWRGRRRHGSRPLCRRSLPVDGLRRHGARSWGLRACWGCSGGCGRCGCVGHS